jgi:hypothetical protein
MRMAVVIESVCVFAAPVRGRLETSLIVPLGLAPEVAGVAIAQPPSAAASAARADTRRRVATGFIALAYYLSRYQKSRACAEIGGAVRNVEGSRYHASRTWADSGTAVSNTGAASSNQRSFIADDGSRVATIVVEGDDAAGAAVTLVRAVEVDCELATMAATPPSVQATIVAPTLTRNFGRFASSSRD